MKEIKRLKINGTMLEKAQLDRHLEKIASTHNITSKSDKSTYPIPMLLEDYEVIKKVYNLLNEHLKLEISIHPAGEWLLDNFYIIEETVRQIQKELTLKKYKNFVGIQTGEYKGFARIYVLAEEIVAYTENKIEKENLEEYLKSYQEKKTLSMDEIWNIGIFLQIAIIQNIRSICERIASAQLQKYKVENIVERLVENKTKKEQKYKEIISKTKKEVIEDMKYPFIEYMAYTLKRYGKKGIGYLNVLEETVEKLGTSVSEIISKEHFEIAIQKVLMGNSITSIKKIQRINFLEIFEKINGVEEILKRDPANIYTKMDYTSKEYYRNKIKEIAQKNKISEIYIGKKILEICENKKTENLKEKHIGYYLIDKGRDELYQKLGEGKRKELNEKAKVNIYIGIVTIISLLLSILTICLIKSITNKMTISIIFGIILFIPLSEVVIQISQYILSKIVKPKLIPKIDFSRGIDKENSTIVIIPTILNSKEKVKELMHKLEVYYIANKSPNLYFTLLGDCTQSKEKEEKKDIEIIEEGRKQVKILNEKYKQENQEFPIFSFIYRKRTWNEKEDCYMGWERKRGMINQFNEYILKNIENPFLENTIEESKEKLPQIKYVITLDADTELILNSASKLVGAMAHILNTPKIDKEKNVVVEGYGIMQPRIGVNLDISNKNLFTKIFAGAGGIDNYTNAISDTYQDNFKEGIFTGKGIYDVKVFSKVLSKEIPENTVLSHDLLEGCYLRCGLVSDIMLMDGYPCKYNSFMNRLFRWIRGDWQITKWLSSKKLNKLSKFKILDNLRRSLIEITIMTGIIMILIINKILNLKEYGILIGLILISIIPFILELLNALIFKKEGETKQKTFTPKISGIKGCLIRAILTLGCLPYKAYISLKAIVKTIYRKTVSKKHLLEWTTSEEAEKQAKTDIYSYYTQMGINLIFGLLMMYLSIVEKNIVYGILGILWLITPMIMWKISKKEKEKDILEELKPNEKEEIKQIAIKTWQYFKEYLTKENNYLIPDNYQEDRVSRIVNRTSSTNIGLSLLAVISAYDLKQIELEEALEYLSNILDTISELPKWNGHLYNWYEIKTKEPLHPRYISTVDSGNFIGYLYTVKSFYIEILEKEDINKENILSKIKLIDYIIQNTDFSILYSKEHQIFSIGFNVEENKLTDSYYDLLASEARQASLIAIAKKDVPVKHWNALSRTLTILGKHKGLISWSGTSFEYLMPNINIPSYKGSLLNESCKFMIMSQLEYAKKLQLPWGISEAAFNLKDLQGNYQYKAFGIPWLGLKRGLADEMVISSYGSILAITEEPKKVIENIELLKKYDMEGKYGLYESIDFTPERTGKGKNAIPVKTYMAHHQSLILLSIDNLFNKNIFQKRFLANPEIEGVSILLQETMPEKAIITKENKEKVEKLKYKDYEDYIQETYTKIDENLIRGNVIGNEDYIIAMNQKGEGFSKYKNIYINRFKKTEDYNQGIFIYIKNIKTQNILSSAYDNSKENQYKITYSPDKIEQEITSENIKTKIEIIVAPNEPAEIRKITIENLGITDEILEVTTEFEPIISRKEQDYAHPVFNNLFLTFEWNEETGGLIIKRKNREPEEKEIYLLANLSTNGETIGELEYEIDKEKFLGRGNINIPQMIKNSIPFSKKIGLVTEPISALKRTVKVKAGEKIVMNFVLSISEDKEEAIENIKKYKIEESIEKAFELSKAQVEANSRYLRIKGREIKEYQKMLSYIIFSNPAKKQNLEKLPKRNYRQNDLWKYGISGDLPLILLKIKDLNDMEMVKEVLKAYEFIRTKKIDVELVIMDEEKYSYENYVREEIEGIILNRHIAYLKNIKGGIFIVSKNEIEKRDREILELVSTIVIDANKGSLENAIHDIEEEYKEKKKEISSENKPIIINEDKTENLKININEQNKYWNEYGAFSPDGKEYEIKLSKENRTPTVWSHILANKKFGTLITENMGGYTWYKNCRLNRITTWENMPTQDIPSEIIYLKDLETQNAWSLGLNPMPDNKTYQVIYGFGYAKYRHQSNGIMQEAEIFVPKEDSVKLQILTLKNLTPNRKKLKIIYYAKPTLGEEEYKTDGYINLKYDENNNIIFARNLYNQDFPNDIAYVSCSEKIKSYTGNKEFFIGKGGLENPEALKKLSLNNENSLGRKACITYEIEVELESFGEKEIIFMLGAEESILESKNISYKYSKIQNVKQELENVKTYWKEILEKIQVYTEVESINIILNGWAMYQTIASRMIAKTGYYQSGGAFGFRDQLQDSLALKYMAPEKLKEQIILHSKHQFIEGDVEHWWHEETKRGIRTRFSDDLLWIVYACNEYINVTGDKSILQIKTPYLQGEELKEGEDERYNEFLEGNIEGTIYEHCMKALNRSFNFGENGLPKIGSGDWNDGFNTVGNKGKGESIWIGFFLYKILTDWIPICEAENEKTEKIEELKTIQANLKKALNTNGWDGRWYKRAYMDNGDSLGSMENDECRIDSIAQSWSVISGAGDNDKKYISMESLENHLVDREHGIIKLLDPPFEKGKLEPGYIKAYLPGVRENGGQYTHASCWAIIAEAILGFGDKATELYKMINPIEHARTKDAIQKYKVEPYAIAADIYGAGNISGRGGWTWYTGSASWYYQAGIEYILGLKIKNKCIEIKPCIPKDWKEYQIQYKYGNTIYNINVKNLNGSGNNEIEKVLVNGKESENKISLERKEKVCHIEVILK